MDYMDYKEEVLKLTKAINEECHCGKSVLLEENKTKSIVFYGEPSQGLMDISCVDNRKDFMFQLAKIQHHSNFRFLTASTGRMLVTFARETMAEKALECGAEWLLFIDDDMIIPKFMFEGLMRHGNDADIISPLAFQRVPPYNPVIYKTEAKADKDGLRIHHDAILDYEPGSIVYPDSVGFGVVLIRTEVLKKMPKPWFFSNSYVGEDIYFCIRAKKLGFKCLVDTRVKVGHMASPEFITERDFATKNPLAPEKVKNLYKEVIVPNKDSVISSDLD